MKKNGVCIGQLYPQPPNSIVTEAEAGANQNNSIAGDKLPFSIANAANVYVMSIDNAQVKIFNKKLIKTFDFKNAKN